jgi:hypothetical protein
MATIVFKSKIREVVNMDGTLAWKYVGVPVFQRKHCDMHAFRFHPKYGTYANSDLFPNMLGRIRESLFPNGSLRLDRIPENVSVDDSGFLAEVTVTV